MKVWKKAVILLSILLLVAIGYGIDHQIAASYQMKMQVTTTQPAPADGQTPVVVKVRVSRGNDSAAGHVIFAASGNGGSFQSKRVTTGADGIATFVYYPYLKSALNELTDVTLQFTDESNSLFINVPVRGSVKVAMRAPDEGTTDGSTNDSIFG